MSVSDFTSSFCDTGVGAAAATMRRASLVRPAPWVTALAHRDARALGGGLARGEPPAHLGDELGVGLGLEDQLRHGPNGTARRRQAPGVTPGIGVPGLGQCRIGSSGSKVPVTRASRFRSIAPVAPQMVSPTTSKK